MDRITNEYDVIRSMSGMSYKLFNIIRIMTRDGNVDNDGYVTLSHTTISKKLGIGNNITRILNSLEQFPSVVEIKRGSTGVPNKFKVNDIFLL